MTFMDDYWAGRTDGLDIENYIIAWYEDTSIPDDPAHPKHIDLATYLGMTREQYKAWFDDNALPERGAP